MSLKKIDRYVGEDSSGNLHNIEVHKSGVTPDTWICGNCGTPLGDGQEHIVGLQRGIRYCMSCVKQGKMLKDMPDYTDKVQSGDMRGIIWKGAKTRHV